MRDALPLVKIAVSDQVTLSEASSMNKYDYRGLAKIYPMLIKKCKALTIAMFSKNKLITI